MGLLTLALVGFFILLMVNKVKSPGEVPMNLLIVVILTMMLPFLFTTTSTMIQGVFGGVTEKFEKPGTAIILDNTTDIRAVSEDGWKLKNGKSFNNYSSERQIKMSEKLTKPEKIGNGDPLKKYIYTSNKGKDSPQDIPAPSGVAGWLGDMFATNYYRNNVKFLQIYLTMLVSIVALTITSFKFAIIINKMYGDYVLLITAAPADIMGLQRVKAIFSEIAGSLALIVYVPILYQIYLISVSVIKSLNFDFWTYIVAMAGAAWALMDVPNGFAKVTGIDAGLKSTAAVVAGALGGSKLARAGSKAVGNVAKSAAGALSDVGAFGAGFAADALTDDSGEGTKGINGESKNKDEEPDEGQEDGFDKGINEPATQDGGNENSPETGTDEAGEDVPDNEKDGLNGTDDSQSLDESEPPTDEEGTSVNDNSINPDSQSEMGTDAEQSEPPKHEGVNSSNEEKDTPPDHSAVPLNAQKEDNQKETKESEPLDIDDQIRQKEDELYKLNKTNPLRQQMKNRTLGYDMNDQRRYQRMNRIDKASESFNSGAAYRQHRLKKQKLKAEIKELKKIKEG
ncbi:pLS20_p028 family conjugation system transmembrane protein [Enterococcus termitis]